MIVSEAAHPKDVAPQPLPDEHVLGVVARYHALSAYRASNSTLVRLGLHGPLKAQDVFKPGMHLAIPPVAAMTGQAVLRLVHWHTPMPLWFPAFPVKLLKRWRSAWAESLVAASAEHLQLHDREVCIDRCWRHCPVCLEEDRRRHGVAYWHVSHQIPGLTRCLEHGAMLKGRCRGCERGLLTLNSLPLPAPQCGCAHTEPTLHPYPWEPWLTCVFQKLRACGGGSLEHTHALLRASLGLPKRVTDKERPTLDKLLARLEKAAGREALARVFRFYQRDDGLYMGRKRPHLVRVTMLARPGAIRHPLYSLLLLWAAGVDPSEVAGEPRVGRTAPEATTAPASKESV